MIGTAPRLISTTGAKFDPTRTYRYTLWREWDSVKPRCAFIGLNPSTADEYENDPTVRRCIGFAKRWGYGSLEVGNIFALRSTDPKALRTHPDPVGPGNNDALRGIACRAELLVAAWGNHGELLQRGRKVAAILPGAQCLGITKAGHPIHPLYQPNAATLREFFYNDGIR